MQGTVEELPPGWASTKLGDICDKPQYGWTTKAVKSGSGPKLLRTTDISKGPIIWSTVPVCDQVPPSLEKYLLRKGDFVVSRAGSVGLSALIGDCPDAVFASYLIRFRTQRGISVQYLRYFLQSPSYWEQIAQESAGIALQNVNAKKLAGLTVPLPPLPEQQRIVAEIDKQFTRLDAAESALRRVQANLKRYRVSVLKAAFEGKLVPTEAELAEAEGRDYEPADRLLERILTERRACWESQDERRRKYKEPDAPDTSGLPDLRPGWVWASVDMLTQNYDRHRVPVKAKDRAKLKGPYPYYGASGKIDTVNDYLFDGTFLLIAEDGANLLARTTPIAFVVSGQFWVNNHAHVVKTVGTIPLQYLEHHVNSLNIERYVTGTAQPKLTQTALNRIPVPLPPLAEQVRIVAEVERHLSLIQKAEATVEASLKRVERLRQGILKQAFSGQLVSQYPEDEPASILLERIRAERAATEVAKPKRKRTRRRSKSTASDQLSLLDSKP